jgi:dTDP-4-dehydrorhamnose 3,5-epimerase
VIFTETAVQGAFVIDIERRADERGFFARAWCQREFEDRGLKPALAQVNFSFNVRKGCLRGMHYQARPYEEVKVVSCTRGAIYDVVVDLRHASPSYLQWSWVELTAENHRMLYVPEGCAHGFQTLADGSEVLYLMSQFHSPEHARGVRHDDRALGISWPLAVSDISDADRSWPDYEPGPDCRARPDDKPREVRFSSVPSR